MAQAKKTAQKAASKGARQPQDRQPAKQPSSGKKDDDKVFRITYQGRVYEVGPKDLTDQESSLFRREVGFSLARGLDDPDLDVFIALVWLVDRRADPDLSLDDYRGTMTYADLDDQIEQVG